MVSIQDWKTTECAQIDDSDHVEAIETLASLLEGDITPTDAAKMITKTYEASLKAIEGFWKDEHYHITKVHDFWSRYMTGAIRSFGSAEERERLFELLIEISRQPDLEDHDGMVMKSIDQKIFWSDLPGWNDPSDAGLFNYQFAQEFPPEERGWVLAQSQKFLNGTRFAAILLSRNKFASALPGEASCFLRMGLEHSYDSNSGDMAGVPRVDREE